MVARSHDSNHTFVKRRGPDSTGTFDAHGYHFTHHLLSLADEPVPQPFVDGDVICVCDGVIYNCEEHPSGGALIALYRQHGENFARHLDGEYAIAICDFERRILVLATDAFSTKPLFFKDTEAASYRSALGGGERMPPNTIRVINLDNGTSRQSIVVPFDFDHQHKETYDDWLAAFERAIEKRATHRCYIPLSAGYDSGSIDLALRRLGTSFKSYSFAGEENVEILRQRDADILPMDATIFAAQRALLDTHAEAEAFRVKLFNGEDYDYEVHDDRASHGLMLIHALARAENRRVFLSGSGADEILAACRHWPKAQFPAVLQPWPDFDSNWQIAYLAKEEYTAGSFGVQGRYPYLDRDVVQEFLWLSPELKHRRYKAPLHEYMSRHDYPFEENVKTGFNPLRV